MHDYLFNTLHDQQLADLRAEAHRDRLVRNARVDRPHWWSRLLRAVRDHARQRRGHGLRVGAVRRAPVPTNQGAGRS